MNNIGTKLSPEEERRYQDWKSKLPKNLQYEGDYDLRGFYKENPTFSIKNKNDHLTDKYKLPNHPTFSSESIYYKGNEKYGGVWKKYDYGYLYAPNDLTKKKRIVEWSDNYDPKNKVIVNEKAVDLNSPEYRQMYNSGRLMGYDIDNDTYVATPLNEVVVQAKAPNWEQYRKEYEKKHSKSSYISKYLTPLARRLGNTTTNYPSRLDDEYKTKADQYVAQQVFKNNPIIDGETRGQYLDRLSTRTYNQDSDDGTYKKGDTYRVRELEDILHNNLHESTSTAPNLWHNTLRGIKSFIDRSSTDVAKRIVGDNKLSTKEKEDKLRSYANSPILSALSDRVETLSFLEVPYNATVGTIDTRIHGETNYKPKDALKGQVPKHQNLGLMIVADPLNIPIIGAVSKLGKVKQLNKFNRITNNKSYTQNFLNKDGVLKNNVNIFDNTLDTNLEKIDRKKLNIYDNNRNDLVEYYISKNKNDGLNNYLVEEVKYEKLLQDIEEEIRSIKIKLQDPELDLDKYWDMSTIQGKLMGEAKRIKKDANINYTNMVLDIIKNNTKNDVERSAKLVQNIGNQLIDNINIKNLKEQIRIAHPGLSEKQVESFSKNVINDVRKSISSKNNTYTKILESIDDLPNEIDLNITDIDFPKIKQRVYNFIENKERMDKSAFFAFDKDTPSTIFIGSDYMDDNYFRQVLSHEIGHAIQKALDVPDTIPLEKLFMSELRAMPNYEEIRNSLNGWLKKYYDYAFGDLNSNNEIYPYIREAKESIIKNKLINNSNDKINKDILLKQKELTSHLPQEELYKTGDRLIHILPESLYDMIAKYMNMAPIAAGAVYGIKEQ